MPYLSKILLVLLADLAGFRATLHIAIGGGGDPLRLGEHGLNRGHHLRHGLHEVGGGLALAPIAYLGAEVALYELPALLVDQRVVVGGLARPRRDAHATHGTLQIRLVQHRVEALETDLVLARHLHRLDQHFQADGTRDVAQRHVELLGRAFETLRYAVLQAFEHFASDTRFLRV